jgi:hypothetical protein
VEAARAESGNISTSPLYEVSGNAIKGIEVSNLSGLRMAAIALSKIRSDSTAGKI